MRDVHLADTWRMSEQIRCPECGSSNLVASGVYEHGTWIHRLTCWTCRDCQSIVALREGEATALVTEAD
jgi:transposase-like protein